MQDYYYLKSMITQNLSLDTIEPLVKVGKGYFDAILRKIIFVNINDPSMYESLSQTIAKTIAVELNTTKEQFLMIFGQKFCMNNFFNMSYIENQIQAILKTQNDKSIKIKQQSIKRKSSKVQSNSSYSFFSLQLSKAQLSAYEISCESDQFHNEDPEVEAYDSQKQQNQLKIEELDISYTKWDQSRFMQDKKQKYIKARQREAQKGNCAYQTEKAIRKTIKANQDVQTPSFLRFNLVKITKNQFSFDPQIQKKNEILTYIESVLIPKTQLSLFCQHIKIPHPIYNRKVKDKIFYINTNISMSNIQTKFVQKHYEGRGMAANLKMAQNQASIQLLTKVWLQYPQIWMQFVNRKKEKKLSFY